ncbi:60S ribosomal protein L10-like [Canis lupus dingo]|nr:60S ribosomal protein L10-like [Canis lupus dingo]
MTEAQQQLFDAFPVVFFSGRFGGCRVGQWGQQGPTLAKAKSQSPGASSSMGPTSPDVPWALETALCGRLRGLTSSYLQSRLQTGMRGAFGKPQGTVARVHIGQVITSIRTKLQNKEHVIEALRRAKFKFPGRQKIHISKKWGFTKFNGDEFEDMVAEKRLIPDGCGVTYIPSRGPLDKWRALHS